MRGKLYEKYTYVLEDKLLEEVEKNGQYRKLDAGITLIEIGDELTHMPLILTGAVRIMNKDENDNELLLYYLEVGDTCAMTMSCCLGGQQSPINAVTEQPTELVLIPLGFMEEWIIKYKSWRAFVFDSYSVRLEEMLEAIDILAFHNMGSRLYKYLKDKAIIHHGNVLNITHSQIANELNSSRVVISRLLKKLAFEGKVISQRNRIEVVELMAKK